MSPEPRSKASAGAVPDAPQDLDEEEQALIGRAQAQDQEAFRLLVERYRDRAYGLALRIVRAAPDAEEVAQNAFVRAWLALPRFRGEARFSTWLYRIVARQAFDRLVMLRRRRERETGIEAASGRAGPEASTGAGEAWVLAHRLERLVGKLSDGQRAAVTLFYYEGRSVEQVAETLGMPTGTVKTHLSRARAALRKAWLAHDRAATR